MQRRVINPDLPGTCMAKDSLEARPKCPCASPKTPSAAGKRATAACGGASAKAVEQNRNVAKLIRTNLIFKGQPTVKHECAANLSKKGPKPFSVSFTTPMTRNSVIRVIGRFFLRAT